MIGVVQIVAYLIAIYMVYRGITDALRDFSELWTGVSQHEGEASGPSRRPQ